MWPWRTGYARARSDAAHRAGHRRRRQTTGASGWPAWLPRRCGRRTNRAGIPPLSRGQALDPVLHLAARAVDRFVEMPCLGLRGLERGHDKAWVGRTTGPLGLAHDAPPAAPAVQRRPDKVAKRRAGLPLA